MKEVRGQSGDGGLQRSFMCLLIETSQLSSLTEDLISAAAACCTERERDEAGSAAQRSLCRLQS